MPATNTRSSPASSASSAVRIASIVRNTGASAAGARRLGPLGPRAGRRSRSSVATAGAGSRRAASTASSSSRATDACSASSVVVGDAGRPQSRRACTSSGSRASHSCTSSADPVALGVAFVVAVPAVGRGLDDDGTAVRRGRASTTSLHRRGGRDDVVAVDRDVVDAVAGGALLERRRVLGRRGRELGVAVVLAEEDHRQLPDRGEVDRFVERAVRDRAVAEERDRDAAVVAQLRRGRGAHRDRQARRRRSRWRRRCRASGRRCASSRRARGSCPASLRHQLGEHPERVEALREAVAVAAMGRRDHVGRAERPARADGRRLLPDRQVHEARAPRRRGTAPPPAPRTRGSRASAGASRGGRRR